jgi:hypothetical protein
MRTPALMISLAFAAMIGGCGQGDEASAPEPPLQTAVGEAPPADPAPTPPADDSCGAAQYAALVGQPFSGATLPPEGSAVRYIHPDTQVTMDFRAERLNVDIDANGVITGFRCG